MTTTATLINSECSLLSLCVCIVVDVVAVDVDINVAAVAVAGFILPAILILDYQFSPQNLFQLHAELGLGNARIQKHFSILSLSDWQRWLNADRGYLMLASLLSHRTR